MSNPELQAMIDAATAYHEFFVPALFQEWAPRVVAAVRIEPRDRVLDIGCGTGVLARDAATHVGAGGSVAGLDPNPGMLAVAERLAPQIEWRPGTAESLPYPDRSFEAVVSQFGLMFFADRRQALGEMQRVLAPGGRLAIAVWDSLANTPAYAAEVALLKRVAGPAAAEALRAPFVLGDRRELTALFAEAGMASVDIASHRGTGRFPSVRSMVEGDLRGWLPVMGVRLTEDRIQRVLDEAQAALGNFVTAEGEVVFDSPAHIVTWTKPR